MHNSRQKITLTIVSTTIIIFCILVGYFLFSYNVPGTNSHVASDTVNYVAPLQAHRTTTIDGYQKRVFTNNQGHTLPYYFYQPAHYSPAHKYPLILLLHGGGERAQPHNTPAQN